MIRSLTKARKPSIFLFCAYSYVEAFGNFLLNALPYPLKLMPLRILGVKFGKGLLLDQQVYFRAAFRCVIGRNVSVNHNVHFYCSIIDSHGSVTVKDDVTLSPGVRIFAIGQDYRTVPLGDLNKEVFIQKGAWLCANSVVLPGVTVGEYSVIAAGSVVTKNVPPYEIWGGSPAKKISDRVLQHSPDLMT
jgi:acetyltransferase-like isoleucine patch superfamily enzyme